MWIRSIVTSISFNRLSNSTHLDLYGEKAVIKTSFALVVVNVVLSDNNYDVF